MGQQSGPKVFNIPGEAVAKMERSHVREGELMPILVERKLFRTGENGIAVTLPRAWVNYFHLKPGDEVEIVGDGELIIRIKAKPAVKSP
jgi:hypothetical protein